MEGFRTKRLFRTLSPKQRTLPLWIAKKIVFYTSVYCRPEEYKKKVAEYVKKYATEDALRETEKVWKSKRHCKIFIIPLSGGSLILVRELNVRFFWGRGKRHGTITSQPAGGKRHARQWFFSTVRLFQTDGQCYCRCSLLHDGPKCTMTTGRTVQWCAIS